ncbi:transferrin receptor protein 1 [Hyla sarda]|uniref:transferrin receptor protein 1 n=1 Tax=Hyla sarda TaxID=327740 RepID=UPI0024C3F137|nr:transferrin receptor protein 1 [Hyla sarda]
MAMDSARTVITNIFGRVPLTYTRFSLTPQTDGDSSQVEMKLADEEECGDHSLGDHHVVQHQPRKNGCKSLCFKILVVILLFLIGFLTGYLTYRGRVSSAQPSSTESVQCDGLVDAVDEDDSVVSDPDVPQVLYWSTVRSMLQRKIDTTNFETSIQQQLSEKSRQAGSDNEESLAKTVRDQFNSLSLFKVWNDEHYVTLQGSDRNNKITLLKGDSEESIFAPTSYVAYSPSASVNGSLVYAQYGTVKDFEDLGRNTDLTGKLILVRSGSIPFSEKVRNAEQVKASGVLIYPEPSDFMFPGQIGDIDSPFGHAHFGTGDPFTPGFPSFNHTQFPPSKSSGLPQIPVQTLSSKDGKQLLGKLDVVGCPSKWESGCKLGDQYKIRLEVKNVPAEKKIYNIFGVIKGFDEPGHYVVVGAQRDSMGMGVSKAVVGTTLLVELARMLSEMVKEGYKPKRSIVFASWSAGDFGAVGATEWLEGYLTTLHLKAVSYISLDAIIQGSGSLKVSASPLMFNMIQKILKEVPDPVTKKPISVDFRYGFPMDDAAYPFLTFSGIPSASFSFQKAKKNYAYLDTEKDTYQNFRNLVDVNSMCSVAANVTGQIILRLTHDLILPLDYTKYSEELRKRVTDLHAKKSPETLSLNWVDYASGDFSRAATQLKKTISESDLENKPYLHSLNNRIMKVEHSMLSPYVSPKESPFRHILYGSGNHTFDALYKLLDLLKNDKAQSSEDLFKNQLALFTWTVQSAANALVGEVWEIDNEI